MSIPTRAIKGKTYTLERNMYYFEIEIAIFIERTGIRGKLNYEIMTEVQINKQSQKNRYLFIDNCMQKQTINEHVFINNLNLFIQ